jgi:indole-3-glycerol phosphate synthase
MFLCLLNVGSDPQAVADAYLNGDGKVVSVLADPPIMSTKTQLMPKFSAEKASLSNFP